MILADTSAWVEFVRDTGSAACNRLDDALDGEIAVCDAVGMEVLAGARSERHLQDLRRLLARAVPLETLASDHDTPGRDYLLQTGDPVPLETLASDHDTAASIYRSCRRHGETPRSLIDCLIAAIAIRRGATVLHADRDFSVIARHSTLRTITE